MAGFAGTVCHLCEYKIPPGKYKCPSCGAWQNLDSPVSNDETILLKDAKSSESDRIDVDFLNYCWGGGLTRTSVTLFGGMPGAGKSTLLLQILYLIFRFTKKETMYIATEEAVPEIKSRADRIDIPNQEGIRICPAMTGVANIGGLLAKWQPSAIVIDSLQGMTGGNDLQSIELLQTLKKFCVTLNAPGIVISHVNKEGDYAGLMTFQHAVDTLFLMTPEEDGTRVLEVQKNRFGRAFIESNFKMTAKGMVYLGNSEEQPDTEEESDDETDEE